MTDEIFDPLPGDGYAALPPEPEDEQGDEDGHDEQAEPEGVHAADDIGPPAPGEGDDLPNPEIGMVC